MLNFNNKCYRQKKVLFIEILLLIVHFPGIRLFSLTIIAASATTLIIAASATTLIPVSHLLHKSTHTENINFK